MSEQLKNTLTALLILVMVVSTVVTLVATMPDLAGIERVVYEGEESVEKTTITILKTTTSNNNTVTENSVKSTQATQDTTTHKQTTVTHTAQKDVINVNTATKEELMRVPGIGEVYADRIIAYREQYGNFETLNELTNIKGIGEKRLEKWSTYLIIS